MSCLAAFSAALFGSLLVKFPMNAIPYERELCP